MFKQNSDFMYLTGFNEPNSVLVISKTDSDLDGSYKTALFVKVSYYIFLVNTFFKVFHVYVY